MPKGPPGLYLDLRLRPYLVLGSVGEADVAFGLGLVVVVVPECRGLFVLGVNPVQRPGAGYVVPRWPAGLVWG